ISTSSGAVMRETKMTIQPGGALMTIRHFGAAAALATTLAFASPALAVTEIQWWHAMTGGNNDVVNRLAEEFNASQSEYKVMLSFPFNSSSMVMWINKDELKKAGIAEIPKTWPEVFDAAKKLKAAGHATCGFSNAWATWAHIEQFSAWHNVPIGTRANGLDGFDTVLKFNSPLHVKHLQNLMDLQKDKTYDYGGRANAGEARFGSGEC